MNHQKGEKFSRSKTANSALCHRFNPIRTRQNFLIKGPGGDRFDTTNSNVYNSRTTKDKKSVFASREAQFSDKKSKLFVLMFVTLIFN